MIAIDEKALEAAIRADMNRMWAECPGELTEKVKAEYLADNRQEYVFVIQMYLNHLGCNEMNKKLLEDTQQCLNAACNESEDINQNPQIGTAIDNLKQLIELARSVSRAGS